MELKLRDEGKLCQELCFVGERFSIVNLRMETSIIDKRWSISVFQAQGAGGAQTVFSNISRNQKRPLVETDVKHRSSQVFIGVVAVERVGPPLPILPWWQRLFLKLKGKKRGD